MVIRNNRFFFVVALFLGSCAFAQSRKPTTQPVEIKTRIDIPTKHTTLSLFVAAEDGRLYQLGYGKTGTEWKLPTRLNRADEFYPPAGNGFISEPALARTHADGHTSTDLVFVGQMISGMKNAEHALEQRRIELKDPAYPFTVAL